MFMLSLVRYVGPVLILLALGLVINSVIKALTKANIDIKKSDKE